MPTKSPAASGVYLNEQDMSSVLANYAQTLAAFVAPSKQGPLGPTFVSSPQEFNQLYGSSVPSYSMLHMSVKDFFTVAQGAWINRVASSDAAYPGVLFQYFGAAGSQVLQLVAAESTDPTAIDFSTAGGVTDINENLAYIYAIGPGAYYNNYSVAISSSNIAAPANLVATNIATGGTLAANTYSYEVTAIGKNGETLPSTAATATIGTGVTTGSVSLSWDAVPGALGYRIYGRTAGSELFIATVDSSVTTYVDTGAITPAGNPPSSAPPVTSDFTVEVYDLTVSSATPQEKFTVTLDSATDGFGNQTEIEQVINNNSQYIRVISNAANWTQSLPTITSLSAVQFSGGLDGSAITDSDVINGWNALSDRQLYNANIFVNVGYATPAVQKAMDAVAQSRKDAICILDVPSTEQTAINAVAYRKITLALDSNRSALFGPDLYEEDTDTKKQEYVPISGAIAARLAFTDYTRGVGYSPAGLNRGKLTNAIKQRYNYTQSEREMLAEAQVNYARSLLGSGSVLWEQRTLQTNQSALSFLSVRRLFDVLEMSIEHYLEYSLQEPYNPFTVAQIEGGVSQYLEFLKNQGSIGGYKVLSDTSNYLKGLGALYLYTYVEPTLPINTITLNTIITKQGVNFQELTSPGAAPAAPSA